MAERKKPLPPSWEAPFPETTGKVVQVVSKAAKPVAEPVGDAVKGLIKGLVGYDRDLSHKPLPGFRATAKADEPIKPTEGPNHFERYRELRANAQSLHNSQEEARRLAAGHDVAEDADRPSSPLTRPFVRFIKYTTGYDNVYTGKGFLGFGKERDSSATGVGPDLENTSRYVTPTKHSRQQVRLEELGFAYSDAGNNEAAQNSALKDAVTIFSRQQPPTEIMRFRRGS